MYFWRKIKSTKEATENNKLLDVACWIFHNDKELKIKLKIDRKLKNLWYQSISISNSKKNNNFLIYSFLDILWSSDELSYLIKQFLLI